MKTKFPLIVSILALTLVCAPVTRAQEPSQPGKGHAWEGPRDLLASLTPEEREKLKAAREKAMQDPKVQEARENHKAANEAFFAARKKALLAADPSLEPLIEKVEKELKENRQKNPDKAGPPPRSEGGPRAKDGLLTPEERKKMHAAEKQIKDNPEVAAAFEKRNEAAKKFHALLNDAMLAADPSVAPILKKLEDARKANRPGGEETSKTPPPPGA